MNTKGCFNISGAGNRSSIAFAPFKPSASWRQPEAVNDIPYLEDMEYRILKKKTPANA